MTDPKVIETRTHNIPVDNIDTDQIIPAQFLTTTERVGLGQFCFHGWRYADDGSEKDEHPLRNHQPERHQVLVAGSNFGCGSSREHAPQALMRWNVRCVAIQQLEPEMGKGKIRVVGKFLPKTTMGS